MSSEWIIIVLILLLGGGFWMYQRQQKLKNQNGNVPIPPGPAAAGQMSANPHPSYNSGGRIPGHSSQYSTATTPRPHHGTKASIAGPASLHAAISEAGAPAHTPTHRQTFSQYSAQRGPVGGTYGLGADRQIRRPRSRTPGPMPSHTPRTPRAPMTPMSQHGTHFMPHNSHFDTRTARTPKGFVNEITPRSEHFGPTGRGHGQSISATSSNLKELDFKLSDHDVTYYGSEYDITRSSTDIRNDRKFGVQQRPRHGVVDYGGIERYGKYGQYGGGGGYASDPEVPSDIPSHDEIIYGQKRRPRFNYEVKGRTKPVEGVFEQEETFGMKKARSGSNESVITGGSTIIEVQSVDTRTKELRIV